MKIKAAKEKVGPKKKSKGKTIQAKVDKKVNARKRNESEITNVRSSAERKALKDIFDDMKEVRRYTIDYEKAWNTYTFDVWLFVRGKVRGQTTEYDDYLKKKIVTKAVYASKLKKVKRCINADYLFSWAEDFPFNEAIDGMFGVPIEDILFELKAKIDEMTDGV